MRLNETLVDENNLLKVEIKKLLAVVKEMRGALEWIADKKTDSNGAHSMRSIHSAKQTLTKCNEVMGEG